ILADEPTGALDSATSVQVMDILKEIAKEKLVIMVTHNGDLAEKYSTRIIRLLDGEILSDSNPPTNEEIADEQVLAVADEAEFNLHNSVASQKSANENNAENAQKKIGRRKKKSSMNFFTALALSARNLVTKKLRTFLTIFAGSIGIIGIALVLSISNGFTLYMDEMERTTLNSFPITVSEVGFSFDMEKTQKATVKKGTYPSTSEVVPYDPSGEVGGLNIFTNKLTDEYVAYVKAMELSHPDWAASVSYAKDVKMNLISKTNSGGYKLCDNNDEKLVWWQELLSVNFVKDYYDVIDGRYPENKFEAVLVVDANNRIKADVLKAIGITPTANGTNSDGTIKYNSIDFKKFVSTSSQEGLKFRLVPSDEFYTKVSEDYFTSLPQSDYETAYNKPDGDFVKIVGIIRNKSDKDITFFGGGVGYLSSLTDYVIEQSASSQIVQAQKDCFVDTFSPSHNEFKFDFSEIDKLIASANVSLANIVDLLEFKNLISEADAKKIKNQPDSTFEDVFAAVKSKCGSTKKAVKGLTSIITENMSIDENTILSVICPDYTKRLAEIGATALPSTISIYPASYTTKSKILSYLDAYNEDKADKDKIQYTDMASTITSSMSEMIDIVSYVLIAFAAISLFVSSIMIAIITYISVLERTKEIGVLRSLGARKIDISNVFNAETVIIGLSSGIFGVYVAAILNFPINAIINKLAGGLVNNIAKLAPLHGILLVLLSVLLTLISGLIPAIIASKKDPVVALRSN
ncbi:MAG: FtsX-like permease family protein, partial [Eubacteriales bacterium]|nr:FtsX-like permease family protein [Eubacteriales bacterium]